MVDETIVETLEKRAATTGGTSQAYGDANDIPKCNIIDVTVNLGYY